MVSQSLLVQIPQAGVGGTTTWFSSLFTMKSEHKDAGAGPGNLHSPPMVGLRWRWSTLTVADTGICSCISLCRFPPCLASRHRTWGSCWEHLTCAGVQTIRVPPGVSEQEEVQVQVTRVLVESYFSLVRASLQDSVPKAVMHFLVLWVQRGLQQHLIRTLYKCSPCPAAVLPSDWQLCTS